MGVGVSTCRSGGNTRARQRAGYRGLTAVCTEAQSAEVRGLAAMDTRGVTDGFTGRGSGQPPSKIREERNATGTAEEPKKNGTFGMNDNKSKMVGVTGFEPATLCSQSRCATKLRYTPVGFSPLGNDNASAERKPILALNPDCGIDRGFSISLFSPGTLRSIRSREQSRPSALASRA